MKREIHPLDIKMMKLAKEGKIKEFVQAMLEHPVHGKLMRAFSMEEKFGVSISKQCSNGGVTLACTR